MEQLYNNMAYIYSHRFFKYPNEFDIHFAMYNRIQRTIILYEGLNYLNNLLLEPELGDRSVNKQYNTDNSLDENISGYLDSENVNISLSLQQRNEIQSQILKAQKDIADDLLQYSELFMALYDYTVFEE